MATSIGATNNQIFSVNNFKRLISGSVSKTHLQVIIKYLMSDLAKDLTSTEKLSLNAKVRKISVRSEDKELISDLEAFKRVFMPLITLEDVKHALDKSDFDFIIDLLERKFISHIFYEGFEDLIKDWAKLRKAMTKDELRFFAKVFQFLKDKPGAVKSLSARILTNKHELVLRSFNYLIYMKSLDESKYERKNDIIHSKQVLLLKCDEDKFKVLVPFINSASSRIEFLESINGRHIVGYLIQRYLAMKSNSSEKDFFSSLIHQVSDEQKAFVFRIILEFCLDGERGTNTSELLKLLFRSNADLVLELIEENPHLYLKIRKYQHCIAHHLLESKNFSIGQLQRALEITGDIFQQDETKVTCFEVALSKRNFLACQELVKQKSGFTQFSTLFTHNPPIWFVKFLQSKGYLKSLNEDQILSVLKCCSAPLIIFLLDQFPKFKDGIRNSKNSMEHFLHNPNATEKLFDQLFNHTDLLVPPLNFEDDESENPWTTFFQEVITSNPKLDSSLVLKFLSIGVKFDTSMFIRVLFKGDYQKGFLATLIQFNPQCASTLELLIKNPFLIKDLNFSINKDLYNDLFAFSLNRIEYLIISFFVDCVNRTNNPKPFMEFLSDGRLDIKVRSLVYCKKQAHPFCLFNISIFQQLKESDLEILCQLGTYKQIFGESYLFLMQMIKYNVPGLFINYIEKDFSIFDHQSHNLNGHFYKKKIIQVVSQVLLNHRHLSEGFLMTILGIERVSACLNEGVQFNFGSIMNKGFSVLHAFMHKKDIRLCQLPKVMFNDKHRALFSPYLNHLNGHMETPLQKALRFGYYDYAIYFLTLGAPIDFLNEEGANIFHIMAENLAGYLDEKSLFLEFLVRNRYKCTSLLLKSISDSDSPFVKILKKEHGEIILRYFTLFSVDLPTAEDFGLCVEQVYDYKPQLFDLFIQNFPSSYFKSLSKEFILRILKKLSSKITEKKFIEIFELLIKDKIDLNDPQFLEIAFKFFKIDVIAHIITKKEFNLEKNSRHFEKLSMSNLVQLAEKTNNSYLDKMYKARIVQQENKFKKLIELGLLKKEKEGKVREFFEQANCKQGFEELIDSLYQFDPNFFKIPVIEFELPPKEDTSNYPQILAVFDEVVPAKFTIPDDNKSVLSKAVLRKRLQTLVRFIEERRPHMGVPPDINAFYKRLEHMISHLLDVFKELNDVEKTRSAVVDIAMGGPSLEGTGHCGERWQRDCEDYCRLYSPLKEPLNFTDWFYLKMRNFREHMSRETLNKLNNKGTMFAAHIDNLIMGFLIAKRGLSPRGNPGQDKLVKSSNIDERKALTTFDEFHKPSRVIYEFLLPLLNTGVTKAERASVDSWIQSQVPELKVDPQERSQILTLIKNELSQASFKFDFVDGIDWDSLNFQDFSNTALETLHIEDPDEISFLKRNLKAHWFFLAVLSKDFSKIDPKYHQITTNLTTIFEPLIVDWLYLHHSQYTQLRKSFITMSEKDKQIAGNEFNLKQFTLEYLMKPESRQLFADAIYKKKTQNLKDGFNEFSKILHERRKLIALIQRKLSWTLSEESVNTALKTSDFDKLLDTAIIGRAKEELLMSCYELDEFDQLKYYDLSGNVVEMNERSMPHFNDLVAFLLLVNNKALIQQ